MSAGRTGGAPRERWHAVRVVPGKVSCEAVRQLRSQRFLSAEAPRLPLPGCAAGTGCDCVYRHYADRRSGPRRAAERGFVPSPAPEERRECRDRRETSPDSPTRPPPGRAASRDVRAGR